MSIQERARWLYRRFESPTIIVSDEDLKEEKEIDRFIPCRMIIHAMQGYTAMVWDRQERVYRCVKGASQWLIQERLSLNDRPIREDFSGERDLLRRLNEMNDCHSSICKYITSWETPEQSYYAMEYFSNGSLFDFTKNKLHSGARPISNAVRLKIVSRVMSLIVDGLAWLHSKSILHMDLSLENILMANASLFHPRIKIIDFGAALDFSGKEKTGPLERVEWTHDQWVGKPDYVVPEVARNKPSIVKERGYRIPYDAKAADIGTLGSILFIMIVGGNPSEGLQEWAHENPLNEWIYKHDLESRFDAESLDLLTRLWTPEETRITMDQLMNHPFIIRGQSDDRLSSSSSTIMTHDSMDIDVPDQFNEFPSFLTRIPTEIISSEDEEDDDDDPDESCEGLTTEYTLNHSVLPILSRQRTIHEEDGMQIID